MSEATDLLAQLGPVTGLPSESELEDLWAEAVDRFSEEFKQIPDLEEAWHRSVCRRRFLLRLANEIALDKARVERAREWGAANVELARQIDQMSTRETSPTQSPDTWYDPGRWNLDWFEGIGATEAGVAFFFVTLCGKMSHIEELLSIDEQRLVARQAATALRAIPGGA